MVQLTDWLKKLTALRRQWERDDDAIALMPDSLLGEARRNPRMSRLDRARVKARLRGRNGKNENSTN